MKFLRALILGDTHTYWERIVPQLKKIYKIYNFDIIIQVGDLAYLPKMWGESTISANKLLINFINKNNLKLYWIDGNHEDHSILQYVQDFNTSIHNVYGPNFFYMPRGSYLELDRYVLFFVGGAETRDKHNRVLGVDYFLEEIITRDQENFVLDNIEVVNKIKKPVILIAHTVPNEAIEDERNILDLMSVDINPQNRFLSEAVRQLNPIMYFHGHFHRERIYHLSQLNPQTTFYSIGAWVGQKNEVNDRKFFVVDL